MAKSGLKKGKDQTQNCIALLPPGRHLLCAESETELIISGQTQPHLHL